MAFVQQHNKKKKKTLKRNQIKIQKLRNPSTMAIKRQETMTLLHGFI